MDFTFNFLQVFFRDPLYAGPIIFFLVLLICTIGLINGRIEGWSRSDALYHAFINAATVGYGDFPPTKRPCKSLAILLTFIGLIFTGIVVAIAIHAADHAFGTVYGTSGFLERYIIIRMAQ